MLTYLVVHTTSSNYAIIREDNFRKWPLKGAGCSIQRSHLVIPFTYHPREPGLPFQPLSSNKYYSRCKGNITQLLSLQSSTLTAAAILALSKIDSKTQQS